MLAQQVSGSVGVESESVGKHIQYVVMKKIGILASANGDVNSATRDPASMPAPYTLSAAYVSLEMATALA